MPLGKPGYLRVELIFRPDGTFAEHSVFPGDKGFTLDETGKYWLSGDKIVMDGGLNIHDSASLGPKEIHSPSYREMFLRSGQIVLPADEPVMVFIRKPAEPCAKK